MLPRRSWPLSSHRRSTDGVALSGADRGHRVHAVIHDVGRRSSGASEYAALSRASRGVRVDPRRAPAGADIIKTDCEEMRGRFDVAAADAIEGPRRHQIAELIQVEDMGPSRFAQGTPSGDALDYATQGPRKARGFWRSDSKMTISSRHAVATRKTDLLCLHGHRHAFQDEGYECPRCRGQPRPPGRW